MLNLRECAKVNKRISRFSYQSNDGLIIVIPKKGEQFYVVEEYLGDRSILFVVCENKGEELWRHNVATITRITWLKKSNG